MKYLATCFILLSFIVTAPTFAVSIDVDTTFNEGNPLSGTVHVFDGDSPPTVLDVVGGQHNFYLLTASGSSIVNVNSGEIRGSGVLDDDDFCDDCVIRLFDSSELNVFAEARVSGHDDEAVLALGHSVVNVRGGLIDDIWAGELSTINVFGGNGSGVSANDMSTVNLYDGSIRAYESAAGVKARDSSTVNVYGGSFWGFNDGGDRRSSILMTDSSTVNFFGGSNYKLSAGGGTANFFGFNLAFTDGVVTGKSARGTDFNVSISSAPDSPAQVILHDVPEPSAIALISLSFLTLIRFRVQARTGRLLTV